ncbi:hypothetical protein [Fannyhessea vaginae]|uniref:hypothetical protein n=1 Tax=Fannyhessea vaginae TaxID=82135 RepID=UPI0019D3BC9A|nr:hypothetical protein [Fannyhessea vaginae]
MELSTVEIAGDHRGSTPLSHAASAKVWPCPARGEPLKYELIRLAHLVTNESRSVPIFTCDNGEFGASTVTVLPEAVVNVEPSA